MAGEAARPRSPHRPPPVCHSAQSPGPACLEALFFFVCTCAGSMYVIRRRRRRGGLKKETDCRYCDSECCRSRRGKKPRTHGRPDGRTERTLWWPGHYRGCHCWQQLSSSFRLRYRSFSSCLHAAIEKLARSGHRRRQSLLLLSVSLEVARRESSCPITG